MIHRRRLAAAAVVLLVVASPAVAPVRLAYAAPRPRLVELAVPAARSVRGPLSRLPAPVGRPVAVPFAVSHLGVRWHGDEGAPVHVRTAPAPGRWGEWRRLEVAHDLGDEDRGVVLSGLVRADGARLVQVRTGSGARAASVVAVDAVNGPRRLVPAPPPPAAGEVAGPPVVARSQWGADESMRRGVPVHAPVSSVVVHHTVTPNDDPDPPSTMRAMYAYHVQANGWDDLGYNFVVDAAGRVYEGRWAGAYRAGETPTGESPDGRGVVGAHAERHNEGSVGIAVLGTFTDRAPPRAAIEAVQRLIAWKADRAGIDPGGSTTWNDGRTRPTVSGHRDVGSTACPGDHLYAALPGIRSAAGEMVAAARTAATPGYWALTRDGRVLGFGRATAPLGAPAAALVAPAAAIAATPSGRGYWVATDTGRVVPFGDALLLGSPELVGPAGRPVAMEATPSGLGYWVLEESGRVRAFGDAPDLGSAPAGAVDLARTPSGKGYWVAGHDGRVSAFGDALAFGPVARRSAAPVVAIVAAEGGRGYWLVAGDGNVVAVGAARRAGGLPERRVATRVVAARPSVSGRGYYLLAGDGAVHTFGDAAHHGGATGQAGPGGAADMAVMR